MYTQNAYKSFVFFSPFFLITVDVWVSLRVPRLIPQGPGVNSLINTTVPSKGLEAVTSKYSTIKLYT